MAAEERDATVFNLERLAESAGGDQELMRDLVTLYLQDTKQKLVLLEDAVASGRAQHSGTIAHGIKGASAAVGAEEAAQAFRALEHLGRDGDQVNLGNALHEARVAFERARDQLRPMAA